MENRHGILVDAMLTQADGTAERDAAFDDALPPVAEASAAAALWSEECRCGQGV